MNISTVLRLALALTAASAIAPPPASAASPPSEAAAPLQLTPAQTARKARSESILKAEGVPFIAWLPAVEDEADYRPRSTEEIAARAYALTLVGYKATSGDHEGANRAWAMVKDRVPLSPSEADFLADESPSIESRIHFSWQSEAARPLFWTLGYIDTLERPEDQTDPDPMMRLVSSRSFDELVAGAKLRPQAELLDTLDLTYRYHWAVRQAGLDEMEPPAGLNPDVLMERHKALNWLVRYNDDAAWDDVTTDT